MDSEEPTQQRRPRNASDRPRTGHHRGLRPVPDRLSPGVPIRNRRSSIGPGTGQDPLPTTRREHPRLHQPRPGTTPTGAGVTSTRGPGQRRPPRPTTALQVYPGSPPSPQETHPRQKLRSDAGYTTSRRRVQWCTTSRTSSSAVTSRRGIYARLYVVCYRRKAGY